MMSSQAGNDTHIRKENPTLPVSVKKSLIERRRRAMMATPYRENQVLKGSVTYIMTVHFLHQQIT